MAGLDEGGVMTDWLPYGHRLSSSTDPPVVRRAPSDEDYQRLMVWQSFGQAVLGLHYRVELTAMCRCGRTVVDCDVMAQARAHGLTPELPEVTDPTHERSAR